MKISEFIRVTKARLAACTPKYFKIWINWYKRLGTGAGSVVAYSLINPGFSAAMEAHHIITACYFIISGSLVGGITASLPTVDPKVGDKAP